MEPEPSTGRGAPVLSIKGLTKTFPGGRALNNVSIDVLPGEVHGLVGQNGSGKSTLIKVLAGYHYPDRGARLVVGGTEVALPLSPADPRQLGISFVHQDLGLAETASVLENLRVGRYETSPGWRISWREEERQAAAALDRVGSRLDLSAPLSTVRDVDRTMVAVARALQEVEATGRGLLVLDEPTAHLPRDAAERLFEAVRAVAAAGTGVLFVSHRLEEIQAITDRVSVLRDGTLVDTQPTSALTQDELVDRILGFSLSRLYPVPHRIETEPVASVRSLQGRVVKDFSTSLNVGEILGATGLLGMGHDELPYLLFGARRAKAGTLEINGREYALGGLSPREAMKAGLALAPGNRARDGGVGDATVTENVTLPSLGSFFQGGRLRFRAEVKRVDELISRFQVVPRDPSAKLETLSGGNQQKALLAKWFETGPSVCLVHEPTQGVDIGAKRQIFQLMREAADAGTAFVLASSEYEDLAHICDRVLVFRDGRVVSSLHGSDLTHERLVEQCYLEAEPHVQHASNHETNKGDVTL